jgi:hypothetical protein
MPELSRPTQEQSEQRPALLLLVYSWDMFSAILAIFEALAPFAGGVAIGVRMVDLPLALQLLGALSSAAYAAILIIVASLLTRRKQWIQRIQIIALGGAIVLSVVSLLIGYASGGVDIVPVLTTALIILIDLLAIVVMTERRVIAWYSERSRPPRYAAGTLGFWVVSSVALIIVDAVR